MEQKEGNQDKFNFSKISGFLKKHAMILTLLAVICLQFVPNGEGTFPWGGIWMRNQVQDMPQAHDWAVNSVEQSIKAQLANQINQQYPNLPDANKKSLVDDKLAEFKQEAADQIDKQVANSEKEIKKHFRYEVDGESYPYMPDIDTYFYLRSARNVVEKGHVHDELKDGEPWNNHMLAPLGRQADKSIHGRVLASIFGFFKVFNPNIPLMQAANYFPIIFMLLSFIPAFFIGRRFGGNIAGFFAVTMLAIMPAIMGRTPWGHADTDAYNVFFPLMIMWLAVEMMNAKKAWSRWTLCGLAGVFVGLYSKAWGPGTITFQFVFLAMIAYAAALLAHRMIVHKADFSKWFSLNIKKSLLLTLGFVFSSGLFLSIFGKQNGFAKLIDSFSSTIGFTTIKNAARINLWPNVMTTVAELNTGSFSEVIKSVGGPLLFFIAVLGVFLLIIQRHKDLKFKIVSSIMFLVWFIILILAKGNQSFSVPFFIAGCALMGLSVIWSEGEPSKIFGAVLLLFWFVGTTYASLKGVRFTLLAGPAFAVAFGAAIGIIANGLSKFCERQLKISKVVCVALVILITGIVIMNPVQAGNHPVKDSWSRVKSDVPLVNDGWWSVLTKINEESAEDAIINSWWDFGHFFKYIADRAVTFDGASQNTPQAHWIGKALQTDDENETVGILRMLDCGANTAFDNVLEQNGDIVESVSIVKRIILMDRNNASQFLQSEGIDAEKVLPFTHCDPPENYFITSADMVGKAGVWSHFGLWDFEKAYIWSNLRDASESEAVDEMMSKFGYSEERATEVYDEVMMLENEQEANKWISPYIGYHSSFVQCKLKDNLAQCANVFVNLSNYEAEILLDRGVGKPKVVIVATEDGFEEYERDSPTAEVAVLLVPSGRDSMRAMLVDHRLATSMFTRLFFLDGHGTDHFERFAEANQLAAGKIIAWKVDWDGTQDTKLDVFVPKTEVSKGDKVSLKYIGYLENGTLFDASLPGWRQKNLTASSPFTDEFSTLDFVAGSGQVIAGFDRQVLGMGVNETKTITIPPEQGYGTDPDAHPLGNKTLNFKLRIVDIV